MNTTTALPVVGQRVRALSIPGITDDPHYAIDSLETTVVRVSETSPREIYGEFTAARSSNPKTTHLWYFTDWEPVEDAAPEVDPEIVNLRARIERLERVIKNATDGFAVIGERLISEAQDRGWCEEFDRIIDDVNSQLVGFQLPTREDEFEVMVEVSGRLTYTTTVSVTARSQSEANEMVAENMDDYVDADDILTHAALSTSFVDIECEIN